MDSGAFQDLDKDRRISFQEALDRQLQLEEKLGLYLNGLLLTIISVMYRKRLRPTNFLYRKEKN